MLERMLQWQQQLRPNRERRPARLPDSNELIAQLVSPYKTASESIKRLFEERGYHLQIFEADAWTDDELAEFPGDVRIDAERRVITVIVDPQERLTLKERLLVLMGIGSVVNRSSSAGQKDASDTPSFRQAWGQSSRRVAVDGPDTWTMSDDLGNRKGERRRGFEWNFALFETGNHALMDDTMIAWFTRAELLRDYHAVPLLPRNHP